MREFRLMRTFRAGLLLFYVLSLAAAFATAQEDGSQPSLGDIARQARLKKQKETRADAKNQTQLQTGNAASPKRDAAGNSASDNDASDSAPLPGRNSKKVITNEELPEHASSTSTLPQHPKNANVPDQPAPEVADGKVPAQQWKAQIRALKDAISNLESQIQDVSDSIRYAGGSCVSNCAQWNEQQQQKEQQVKMMTSQLAQQQQSLETMQDTARKQGYGSSVYDP